MQSNTVGGPGGEPSEHSHVAPHRCEYAPRVEPIPNFFIVGAPKCATTAMDLYLAQHPEIFMAPAKEPHFFAKDLYRGRFECPEERYFRLFEAAGDESIVGESSVFYLLSKTAAAAIQAFQPRAKILVMLRNPIDVIASHHSQILYEAIETESDLEQALALEETRKAALDRERATFRDIVLHYREVVAFSEQIERFLARFPGEQIHFVLYDDLKADLPGTYRSVLEFLGVDPNFRPDFQVVNANKRARSAAITNFLRFTPESITRLSRLVLPRRSWRLKVRERIKRLNTQYRPRPPMPAHLRESLRIELTPEIDRLGELLNRDLGNWRAPPAELAARR